MHCPIGPQHGDKVRQARFIGVVVGKVPPGLILKVDAAPPGNRFQKSGFSGSVLADEEDDGPFERQFRCPSEGRDIERITAISRELVVLYSQPHEVHIIQTSPLLGRVASKARDRLLSPIASRTRVIVSCASDRIRSFPVARISTTRRGCAS